MGPAMLSNFFNFRKKEPSALAEQQIYHRDQSYLDAISMEIEELRELLGDYDEPVMHGIEIVEREAAFLRYVKGIMDCKPRPSWLKSTEGVMIYINNAYTDTLGVSLEEYQGGRDHDITGNENNYDELDQLVMDTKVPQEGWEWGKAEKTGSFKVYVVKWPVYISGVFVGVAGEALKFERSKG